MDSKYVSMAGLLELSVLMRVVRIREQWDGHSRDLWWNACQQKLAEGEEVLQYADSRLLFRGKGVKKGVVANSFNTLAEAVAILAFVPGGVTIFGNHYRATFDGDPKDLSSWYSVQAVGANPPLVTTPKENIGFAEDAPIAPDFASLKKNSSASRQKAKRGKGFAVKQD